MHPVFITWLPPDRRVFAMEVAHLFLEGDTLIVRCFSDSLVLYQAAHIQETAAQRHIFLSCVIANQETKKNEKTQRLLKAPKESCYVRNFGSAICYYILVSWFFGAFAQSP